MIRIDKRGIVLLVVAIGFFMVFDYIYANNNREQQPDIGRINQVEAAELSAAEPAELQTNNYIESLSREEDSMSQTAEDPQDSKTIEDIVQLESILLLVNKSYQLPSDYVPKDLTEAEIRFSPGIASSKKMMRQEAAEALRGLFQEAESQNIILYGVSGYRSYDTQRQIYERKVAASGQAMADRYVAYPGKSEHQTGLAMDVTNQNGINKSLTEDFGETQEGRWLGKNAHLYGFIIRYPLGEESITGYSYEPWHIRYVGKAAAEYIKSNKLILEQYVNSENPMVPAE